MAYTTIDEYIAMYPEEIAQILTKLRKVIKEAAPESVEKISYQMPAFHLHGNLVYFGVFKNHIGFFPTPSGVEAFKDRLSDYKMSKGTIQFPFDKAIPYDLVAEIVRFRVLENLGNVKQSKK